jgi:hypothetical protein
MCGDEFLETKILKIQMEIFPEVRPLRVIAVTEYNLTTKLIFVVVHFLVNIFEASIELIVLRILCGV